MKPPFVLLQTFSLAPTFVSASSSDLRPTASITYPPASTCSNPNSQSDQQPLQRRQFSLSSGQICGYITEDVYNPYHCSDGQYCNTVSGYFACCNTFSSHLSTDVETESYDWTETLSLTASGIETGINYDVYSNTDTIYSYADCSYQTKCYGSQSALTDCTGACASNPRNLVCTDPVLAFCGTLTSAPSEDNTDQSNTTWTAFMCAPDTFILPLFGDGSYPTTTIDDTSTTTTEYSSFSPTAFTPTATKQSSVPLSAGTGTTFSSTQSTTVNLGSTIKPYTLFLSTYPAFVILALWIF